LRPDRRQSQPSFAGVAGGGLRRTHQGLRRQPAAHLLPPHQDRPSPFPRLSRGARTPGARCRKGRGPGRLAARPPGHSADLTRFPFLRWSFAMQSSSPTRLASKLHVGIIMDGNGRWAARRGLPRLRGHEAGIEALRRVVEAAPDQGVGTLTLYAFSADNWRRPKVEVAALMGLLRFYLANEVESLVRNGVRLTVIGRRDRLPDGISAGIARAG